MTDDVTDQLQQETKESDKQSLLTTEQKENFDIQCIQSVLSEVKKQIDRAATFYNTSQELISFVMNLLLNANAQVFANFFRSMNLTDNDMTLFRKNIMFEFLHQMHLSCYALTQSYESWGNSTSIINKPQTH